MVDSEGFLGRLKRTTKLINGRVEPPHIHEAGPHRTPGDKGTRMILPQSLPAAVQHRLILDQGLAGPPHGTKLPRILIANQQGIWVIFARDLHANRKKLFGLGQCLSAQDAQAANGTPVWNSDCDAQGTAEQTVTRTTT